MFLCGARPWKHVFRLFFVSATETMYQQQQHQHQVLVRTKPSQKTTKRDHRQNSLRSQAVSTKCMQSQTPRIKQTKNEDQQHSFQSQAVITTCVSAQASSRQQNHQTLHTNVRPTTSPLFVDTRAPHLPFRFLLRVGPPFDSAVSLLLQPVRRGAKPLLQGQQDGLLRFFAVPVQQVCRRNRACMRTTGKTRSVEITTQQQQQRRGCCWTLAAVAAAAAAIEADQQQRQ